MMSHEQRSVPANGATDHCSVAGMNLGSVLPTLERRSMPGEAGVWFALRQSNTRLMPVQSTCKHRNQKRRVQADLMPKGNEVDEAFRPTPGPLFVFGALLPLNAKAPFDLVNPYCA